MVGTCGQGVTSAVVSGALVDIGTSHTIACVACAASARVRAISVGACSLWTAWAHSTSTTRSQALIDVCARATVAAPACQARTRKRPRCVGAGGVHIASAIVGQAFVDISTSC